MKKEIDLIQHYNKYVNYHSFLDDGLNDSLLLEIPKNISSVLDLGCGDGRLVNLLPEDVYYMGIDYSINRIIKAIEKYKLYINYFFICSNLENFIKSNDCNKQFDMIFFIEVLEHLENPLDIIRKIKKKYLTKNGKILATIPINKPNYAHIQLFKDKNDVIKKLNPLKIKQIKNYFILTL